MNQPNSEQTPMSSADKLSQTLAAERERFVAEKMAELEATPPPFPYLLWGLLVVQIVALTLAFLLFQADMAEDVASQYQVMPDFFETFAPQPIQPDFETRVLELPQMGRLGETIPLDRSGLRVRGMELTQGIQVFNEPENPRCNPIPTHEDYMFCNNSTPLVAGRHTMVRVYLDCDGRCPQTDSTLRLRVFKDGLERATLTQHVPLGNVEAWDNQPLPNLQADLANSVNFTFKPAPQWLSGPITFKLESSPINLMRRTVEAQELGSLMREFIPRKPLRVAYLPIQYKGKTAQPAENVDYWLMRLFPVSEVEYFRLPVPDLVWEGDLDKNKLLRKLLYTYWLYAVYHPVQTWPDQLFGWLPQEYYNGGASDPFWCANCAGPHSSRVAFGGVRPELDIGGPRILVHEIAHNLGAQHAWSPTQAQDAACFRGEGVDIQVDPLWPYQQTPYIQEVGVDLYSDPPVVYSAAHYDMMAYCAAPWVSPYTYRMLFDSPFLQPNPKPLPLSDYRPATGTTDTGALLISGDFYRDGTVSTPEVVQLDGQRAASMAAAFAPASAGDYCLTVEDVTAQPIGEHCFEVGFVNPETGLPTEDTASFFVTLPNITAEMAHKIRLSHRGETLTVLQASATPPTVQLMYPTGGDVLDGQQTIRWQGSDADGDSLMYDVLYSPDSGESWLPLAVRLRETSYTFHTRQLAPTESGLIRIVASDGFHTRQTETDAPFQLNQLPQNSLSLQGPVNVAQGQPFTVTVQANELSAGLAQAEFDLTFDPMRLQLLEMTPSAGVTFTTPPTVTVQTGTVQFDLTHTPLNTETTTLPLATLRLRAIDSEGQTELSLRDVAVKSDEATRLLIGEIWGITVRITSP